MRRALPIALLLILLAPSTADAQTRPSAQLSLASQTPWVKGESPFVVRIDVDAVRVPAKLDLVVTVHRAVRSRSQFAQTIDGDSLGSTVHTDRVAFDTLPFDPGGAIPLRIDLPELRTGVYPVAIELVDTDTDDPVASLVTHLLKVPAEPVEIPLSVAWVQPYGADPALRTDGSVVLDADELDDLRVVAAQLDAGVPLTVTPTPETIAALATIDDGQTVDALAELLEGHQIISAPYVDLNLSALVAAGRVGDFASQRTAGDRTLDETLGIVGDNRSWAANDVLTPAAVHALDELGVRRVVVDETALEPLDDDVTGGLTLARPFRLDGTNGTELAAVAVEPRLRAHFTGRDEVLAAHHLLADLAVLQLDSPGLARGVVISPPPDWRPAEVFLSITLANIASSPLLRASTLDALFDAVDPLVDDDDEPVVRTLADTEPVALGFTPATVDRARERIASFDSLLVDSGSADLDLFERYLLVAESSDLTPDGRRAYVDAVTTHIADVTSKVRVLGDRTFRLTAREGTIPLTVVNDNSFDVRVEIELTSDKLTFTDSGSDGRPERRELVLRANSTTTEAVPVKARTSGAFPLQVTLRSPDGRLELSASRFTVTSTVASGIGLLLSVGAAVFLALWWAKHWRTVRRAQRLVAAE